jgi:NADP-dependent 3-hydroxy acid dehydrogenase YdfG
LTSTIVITGASSGIGKALALHYAAPGVRLGLLGRNAERLGEVAAACEARGAETARASVDVCDRQVMKGWLEQFDATAPVDLLFANAGVMHGTAPGGDIEPPEAGHALMQTNVLGVLNTVQPLLPRMMARRSGQIAIMSSLAGLIPVRDAPSYSASKSAVLAYGLSLRDLLRGHGVGVSVICPGYVTTSMSQRETGDKPSEMPPARAAAIVARGVARNKAVIAFPFWFALATRIGARLPDRWRERVTRRSRFTVEPEAD